MGTFVSVVVGILCGLGWLALLMVPFVVLLEDDANGGQGTWRRHRRMALTCWSAALLTGAAGITYLIDLPSEHAWEGGAGPQTVCHWEQREVMVGKVPEQQQWTVCTP